MKIFVGKYAKSGEANTTSSIFSLWYPVCKRSTNAELDPTTQLRLRDFSLHICILSMSFKGSTTSIQDPTTVTPSEEPLCIKIGLNF